jgi:hypothetical protein
MNNDKLKKDHQAGLHPSIDEYLQMGEEEKDNQLQQSLIRLQNRIFKIVYLMEADLKKTSNPSKSIERPPKHHD